MPTLAPMPPDVSGFIGTHGGPMIFDKMLYCQHCSGVQSASQEWWRLEYHDKRGICYSGDWMCVKCYARKMTTVFNQLKQKYCGLVEDHIQLSNQIGLLIKYKNYSSMEQHGSCQLHSSEKIVQLRRFDPPKI